MSLTCISSHANLSLGECEYACRYMSGTYNTVSLTG